MQVGVASVTVKKKVTLTFIINGVQVFACQPLSTHNCAVKKPPPRDPERLSCSKYQKKTEPF